jgi:hypothetical protein
MIKREWALEGRPQLFELLLLRERVSVFTMKVETFDKEVTNGLLQ